MTSLRELAAASFRRAGDRLLQRTAGSDPYREGWETRTDPSKDVELTRAHEVEEIGFCDVDDLVAWCKYQLRFDHYFLEEVEYAEQVGASWLEDRYQQDRIRETRTRVAMLERILELAEKGRWIREADGRE